MFPQAEQSHPPVYQSHPDWTYRPYLPDQIQPILQHYHYNDMAQSHSRAAFDDPSNYSTSILPSLPTSPIAAQQQEEREEEGCREDDPADPEFFPSTTSRRIAKSRSLRPRPKKSARALSSISTNIPTPRKTKASQKQRQPPPDTISETRALLVDLKGINGPLLEVMPGSQLEGNGLLIIHPPTLEPGVRKVPLNQYNPPQNASQAIENHRSQYEMYTCRLCRKTYDGKNARSVARRHLQDKHGIPLALQKRRSRWDGEPDRPRDPREVRERTLRAKREWAAKNRPCRRLEKRHADFLRLFGPAGLEMPTGFRLLAPEFRIPDTTCSPGIDFLDGSFGRVVIPKEILDGVKAIEEGTVNPEGNRWEDPPIIGEVDLTKAGKGKGKAKEKGKSVLPKSSSISTFASATPPRTLSRTASNALVVTRTPVSDTRSTHADTFQEANLALDPLLADDYGPSGSQLHYFYDTTQAYQSLYEPFQEMPHLQGYGDPPLSAISAPTNAFSRLGMLPDSDTEDDKIAISSEEELSASPRKKLPTQGPQRWVHPEELQQRLLSQYDDTQYDNPAPDYPELSAADEDHLAGYNGGAAEHVENAAAESLLNLHSTPAREEAESETLVHPSAEPSTTGLTSWSATTQLLDAPTIITPRPRPQRATSLIHAFPRNKPEAPTRSLSFTTADGETALDDPFIFSPAPPSSNLPSRTLKRRSTIAHPSPSPLSFPKRRRLLPSSPVLAARKILGDLNGNSLSGSEDRYTTPLRPERRAGAAMKVKNSLTPDVSGEVGKGKGKAGWMLSSPGNLDTAATLGLAPNFSWVEMTPAKTWVPQTPGDEEGR